METIYNQFSKEYNELFGQNINEFYEKCIYEGIIDNEFCTFYPSFGVKRNEPCDFLIIGQAVNGWGSGFYTGNELNLKSNIENAIECSNSFCVAHTHSPIDWVNVKWTKSLFEEHKKDIIKKEFYGEGAYTACRSFFWNVTYKLISDYYRLDRGEGWAWSKKLVWSNLYKIAPDGKNPDGDQKNKQLDLSVRLIKKEIEELKPKFCIVLTNGSWWIPFQENMNTEKLKVDAGLTKIEFHEKYIETEIIVTTRPRFGNSETHVQQILELIK
jgi:hypothetical protein